MMELLKSLLQFDVYNNSGEAIPPYACMELDYAYDSGRSAVFVADGPKLVMQVKKPTIANAGNPEMFVFNGPLAIAIGGFGYGLKLPVLQAIMDFTTPPEPGNVCGPADASWLLSTSGTGFVVKTVDSGLAYESGSTKSVFIETVGGGGGSAISYFVLAEDASEVPVYAWPGLLDSATGEITVDPDATEPFELYHWMDILQSPKEAKAGYAGIYGVDSSGRKVFVNGPCIGGCQTVSSIDPGTPPTGTVDVAYTHTVNLSGLNVSGVSADGLPTGLSIDPDTGEITGTPTVAGTYFVTFTGGSDDTPSCPITRIAQIVIEE